MKVLNVNHLLDPQTGGGTAERTLQISRFLAKAGVGTTVLALDIGLGQARESEREGLEVVTLPCLNQRYFVPRAPAGLIDKLVAYADIVHLSGHWTILNALVYRSCRRQGKPFVFCPAGALTPFGRSLKLKRAYDSLVGRELARAAAVCVAITGQECADFAAYGVPTARVTVIPNGIDPEQYNPSEPHAEHKIRERLNVGAAPYIFFLGRLNTIKGPDLLLEAFSRITDRFPEFHLVLAGPDGGLQAALAETAGQGALQGKIHFPGYLANPEKATALRAATLLAIPSRREAMSIVVLEAGVCGTPTLFTDACGLEEIAAQGAGTMVEVSATALAAGLAGLLADPASTRRAAGRLEALVRDKYLWEMQAARYVALYEQILSGARK